MNTPAPESKPGTAPPPSPASSGSGQTKGVRAVRLKRYAMDKQVEIARDDKIPADLKAALIENMASTSSGASQYGRLVYRLIAIALGLVAVLVVILSFVLLLGGHKPVDSAFYTLGSAAVGALGGVFAPHANEQTPQPKSLTSATDAGKTPDGSSTTTETSKDA